MLRHRKRTTLLTVKRKDIIMCPYFRLNYWEYKKNKFVFDMYCSLDNMIFASRKLPGGLTPGALTSMRNEMRTACSAECPKLWAEGAMDVIDDYDSEEELYQQYLRDNCGIPQYDDNFNFGNPPF